jgi:hypothetical protein
MTSPLASLQSWAATRGRSLGIVLAAGLFIAAPFFTNRGLGTSEAYNYSLAVADFVTQVRAGEFPVLVGQSDYAWNGRIHPLRTAPYFPYAAGLLDLVTFHTLGFWTLQNLVVGLSLLGGVLSCYFCLRRAVPGLGDRTAALLAAAYGLSPGLLSTAYTMDLYMTVMTVPWIPLVLGGLVRAQREGTFGALAQVAIGLGATWLAHPPVAFWLTIVILPAGLAILVTGDQRRRLLLPAASAGLLFAALAGYAFVSALTVSGYARMTHVKDVQLLLFETRRVAATALEPVSADAGQLGDFQLGYAYWALLAVATGLALWRRQVLALALVVSSAFFLALTLPVPGVQAWLWDKLPTLAVTLTNQWPMQRFYLLVTALTIFAFALVWRPPARPLTGFLREVAALVAVAAMLWTGWQSLRFVARGFSSHLDAAVSARTHRPENVNLTLISYALFDPPPWFVNGVMDPLMEFRLRAPFDAHEVIANGNAPFAETVASGVFRVAETESDRLILTPKLRLQPGLRYRLTLDFMAPPQTMLLQLRGRTFFRQYPLPTAGQPRAFGMQPGNSRSLFLWTTGHSPEEVELHLVATGIESQSRMRFASFKLEAVAPDRLPVVVESLVPLRARVHAESAGYLEVPRMYLDGYRATVDGRPVYVQASPDALVLLPVPAGESRVEVRYVGPRLLRTAFWLTCAGWCAVGGWLVLPARGRTSARGSSVAAGRKLWRIKWWLLGAATALTAAAWAAGAWQRQRAAAGPIVMKIVFPRDFWQGSQPLVVTGKPHAGTFVYVRYDDPRHLRIGTDVWGLLGKLSEPIEVDYYAVHQIEISTGALYPLDHPAVRALPPAEREALGQQLRVVLDGRVVLDETVQQYDTKLSEITVGENRIGGSNAGIRFTGTILDVHRGPVRP